MVVDCGSACSDLPPRLLPGAEAMLQGRSHECDWPPAIRHLPVLTASNIHATDSAEIDKQVTPCQNVLVTVMA